MYPIYCSLILFLVCLFGPMTLCASIYGYVDETGSYHFTNIKPASRHYHVVIETKDAVLVQSQAIGRPWLNDEERSGLINQSKALLGVPYKLGGNSLSGIDCSAFVKRMFSSVDVVLPRTAREQYEVGRRISRGELTTGDLVFFRTRRNDLNPTHVGIYMGNDQFIHASALHQGGVRIDSLSSDFYNARFIGASRIRALPDAGSLRVMTVSR
ncbi:MAG TPA: C40 family peptidase [Syntrophorhabdales bacterium]|nr:C40 family peptidase [Syntrophorhabdales bacterium]